MAALFILECTNYYIVCIYGGQFRPFCWTNFLDRDEIYNENKVKEDFSPSKNNVRAKESKLTNNVGCFIWVKKTNSRNHLKTK